ncbi:unnamed protein product, partial [Didymodactylos carnosus]
MNDTCMNKNVEDPSSLKDYSEDDEDGFLDNRKQKRLMSHVPSLNTVSLNDQKPLEEIIYNTIRKHMEILPSRKCKQRQQLIPRHDGECLTPPEAMARLLEKEKAKSQKSEKKKRITKQKSNMRKKLSGLIDCHFSTPTSTSTSIRTDIHCATSTLDDSSA